MFKRENRLVSGIRFNNSYVFATPQFVLKKKENKLSINRFGIVVSKKIDKRAVARNKIKRMLRDVFMNLNKNMIGGHDILFIVKKGILDKTKEENIAAIGDVLRKTGIVRMND